MNVSHLGLLQREACSFLNNTEEHLAYFSVRLCQVGETGTVQFTHSISLELKGCICDMRVGQKQVHHMRFCQCVRAGKCEENKTGTMSSSHRIIIYTSSAWLEWTVLRRQDKTEQLSSAFIECFTFYVKSLCQKPAFASASLQIWSTLSVLAP